MCNSLKLCTPKEKEELWEGEGWRLEIGERESLRFEVGEIDGPMLEVGEKEGILEDPSSLFQGTGRDLQLELGIWVIF